MIKEDILGLVYNISEHIIAVRRDIHTHPELSGKEYRTAGVVKNELNALSIPYKDWEDYPGVVGLIKGAYPGPVIALRADMDALPIQEARTELPFRSQNDSVMHACGHDIHTSVLLGAAAVLKSLSPKLHGSVKLIFQPSEEYSPSGAECMVERGCMEDPHVDMAFALHVDPELEVGLISSRVGAVNAANDNYRFTVEGKSSHSTKPQNGVDAIYTACQIISAIYDIPVRRLSALDSVSLNIGTISGGTADNIIADRVVFGLSMRTTDNAVRDYMKAEIPHAVNAVAALNHAEVDIRYRPGSLGVFNDRSCVDVLKKVSKELYGGNYVPADNPSMTSEDFSAYCANGVLGAMWWLGTGNSEKGWTAPLHNDMFCPDERSIPIGIATQSGIVYALLGEAPTL